MQVKFGCNFRAFEGECERKIFLFGFCKKHLRQSHVSIIDGEKTWYIKARKACVESFLESGNAFLDSISKRETPFDSP